MEPLIESGKQWVAQWRLASAAARWGLAAALVASVAGLAFFNWPQSDAWVPLLGGDVLASAPLTAAQLTAIEAAFGKAQLNEARVAGRSISVPRSKRHFYLKALVDHKALPAHAYAFTERFLANDHPFSSSRQRDEAAKLAKAQEVSLVLQRISGVEEASVLFEDTDLGGFPRRKTRKAVAAVRASGGKPLPAPMITAIRGTVQGTLGIDDAQSITVLDLNAGVTHVAAAPAPRERRVDHGTTGARDTLRTADASQVAPTGANASSYAARSAPARHEATTTGANFPANRSSDLTAAHAGSSRPPASRLSHSPRDIAPAASTSARPAAIAQAAFMTADAPHPADETGPNVDGIPRRSGVGNDPNALNDPGDPGASGDPSHHGESVDAGRSDASTTAPAMFDPHVAAVPLTPRLSSTSTPDRMNTTGLDTTGLDTTGLDTTAQDVFRLDVGTAASPLPDTEQRGDPFDLGGAAGPSSDDTLPLDPLDLSLLDAQRLSSLVRESPATPTTLVSSRRRGDPSDGKHDAAPKAGSSSTAPLSSSARTRSSTTVFQAATAVQAAKAPQSDAAITGTDPSSNRSSPSVAETRAHGADSERAGSAGSSSRGHRKSDPSPAATRSPASGNKRLATVNGAAARNSKAAAAGALSEPTGTRTQAATVSLTSSVSSGSSSAIASGRRESATMPRGAAPGAISSQPFTASVMRPLTHGVQLWVRDNLLTVAGSLLGMLILARIVRSLRATRRSQRAARESLTARGEPAAARFAEPTANARSTFQESEPAGRRQLREQIHADPSGAAAALKQWLGNAA